MIERMSEIIVNTAPIYLGLLSGALVFNAMYFPKNLMMFSKIVSSLSVGVNLTMIDAAAMA
jgi:hypothetical protein